MIWKRCTLVCWRAFVNAKPLAILMMLGTMGSASGQTLNLGSPARPEQDTRAALVAVFAESVELAESDRQRALIRLGARLAWTQTPSNELAARTLVRHMDKLMDGIREAERLAMDPGTDPVLRQRLREHMIRFDRTVGDSDLGSLNGAALERHAEHTLSTLSALLATLIGEDPGVLPSLRSLYDAVDVGSIRALAQNLPERYGSVASGVVGLVDLLDEVSAVPALEAPADRGLRATGRIVGLAQMSDEHFLPRVVGQRLPGAIERCLSQRTVPDTLVMLDTLSGIAGLVGTVAALEGDTARRVEPVLLAMVDRLQSPDDAELLGAIMPPLERSLRLTARGAALPSPGGVSAQLQFSWRFLLPQEQEARVAAIAQLERIVANPAMVASPEVVSALVRHAELVESLEALLGVDVLQRELDGAGVPGAFQALEALRRDLRQMGDRRGYREAGQRVLPIVRTLARFRQMPGSERIHALEPDDPEWASGLRSILADRLEPMRVRLAMQLIAESGGESIPADPERLDARSALETLRRVTLVSSDYLELASGGLERLNQLPEFEVFEPETMIGHAALLRLHDIEMALSLAVESLERDDAQRASAMLDGFDDELVLLGVFAELARRVAPAAKGGTAADHALEVGMVWQRMTEQGPGSAHLLELSLAGRYAAGGLSVPGLRAYATDQAERAIDTIEWLSEAWQLRK